MRLLIPGVGFWYFEIMASKFSKCSRPSEQHSIWLSCLLYSYFGSFSTRRQTHNGYKASNLHKCIHIIRASLSEHSSSVCVTVILYYLSQHCSRSHQPNLISIYIVALSRSRLRCSFLSLSLAVNSAPVKYSLLLIAT